MKHETTITCHSLPCSMDGNSETAAVDAYFLPTLLDSAGEDGTKIYAASFRGRGLLGHCLRVNNSGSSGSIDHEEDSTRLLQYGCLLQVETKNQNTAPTSVHSLNNNDEHGPEGACLAAQIPVAWQDVFEWHHTHQPTTITLSNNNNNNKPNRWQRAHEWCQVAQALHGEEED